MTQVVEGKQFLFTVVAKNSAGRVVPSTDASVTLDAPVGTATVDVDGNNGVFTAGSVDGTANLVAMVAGVSSAPFPLEVVADTAVASVEVVPMDTTVSSVEIVA